MIEVSRSNRNVFIWVALSVVNLIIYAQVGSFAFLHYDDADHVYNNPQVRAGLTAASVKYAFTSVVVAIWMPVTMLSHMLVSQLFGMEPGMHHLANVAIHLLATIVLFECLCRATGAPWPSAFVAFVFAAHPLHVESVAWVSERKDCLSALFWFLALYAYIGYVKQPGIWRYLAIVAWFCLGLMSKPMLVTFPFSLLLFDVWPLHRRLSWRLISEKVPLFALSVAASVGTYFAQISAGSVMQSRPLSMRIGNAVISYGAYLRQTFWPSGLIAFYQYPDSVFVWQTALSAAVLLGVTVVAVLTWRTRPYIAVGWFWYLGTLITVIGLVESGSHARGDRYTYIPLVGIAIMIAWGAADALERWPRIKPSLVAAAVVVCLACVGLARKQTSYWENGVTLFRHAVDESPNNYFALYHLGGAEFNVATDLMNRGQSAEAIVHFEEALRVRPKYPEAHNNLGIQLADMPGRTAEAIAHFEAAIRLDPNLLQAHRNLGMLLASIPGRQSEALAQLELVQRAQPDPEVAALIDRLRNSRLRN
jgi:tetratricopeptide (TPR) repeat protein